MGATFDRVHVWDSLEVLTNEALNEEFDNILENLTPSGVDDYSVNTTQMRLTTDPGEPGSESLADSLAGEIERLRFVVKEMKGSGVTQWYETAGASLTDILSVVSGALAPNRNVSGVSSANSSAARFLIPAGSSNQLTVNGSPTPFIYAIADTQYQIATDLSVSSLSTAPSSNNTASVNDALLSAQESSKWIGEDDTSLFMDSAGSEITALVGKFAAFKIVHGGNTEYFMAFVKSSTELAYCRRGYFFDSSVAPIPRIAIADNDTITLMRLAWIFANTSSGLTICYTNPTVSYSQPSAPNVGDFWYDITNEIWKKYDSVSWIDATATLVGVCILDSSNVVGARAFEYASLTDSQNSLDVTYESTTKIRVKQPNGTISVKGNLIDFGPTVPRWDITADLESGMSEAASTTYHAYVGELGQLKLSSYKPYDRRGDMRGYYHPYENWRYVGKVFNNSSQDFDSGTVTSSEVAVTVGVPGTIENGYFTASVATNALTISVLTADGSAPSASNPVILNFIKEDGSFVQRKLTASLTLVAPATSTLGLEANVTRNVWIYLTDESGTLDIGIVGITPLGNNLDVAATQISTGATSAGTLYTKNTHSNDVSVLPLGRLSIKQATTGQWDTAPSAFQLCPLPGGIVQRQNLVSVGQQISSASGAANTTSTSFGDVTNMSVTITTTGRPVIIMLVPDGGSTASNITNTTGGPPRFQILRDASVIAVFEVATTTAVGAATTCSVSAIHHIDVPAAGTYTYKLQFRGVSLGGGVSVTVNNAKLVAFEL